MSAITSKIFELVDAGLIDQAIGQFCLIPDMTKTTAWLRSRRDSEVIGHLITKAAKRIEKNEL